MLEVGTCQRKMNILILLLVHSVILINFIVYNCSTKKLDTDKTLIISESLTDLNEIVRISENLKEPTNLNDNDEDLDTSTTIITTTRKMMNNDLQDLNITTLISTTTTKTTIKPNPKLKINITMNNHDLGNNIKSFLDLILFFEVIIPIICIICIIGLMLGFI